MRLKKSKLYALIDRDILGSDKMVLKTAAEIVSAGINLIQLRAKRSSDRTFLNLALGLKEIAAKKNATLVINDRLDIALLAQADGVHLGQGDIPVAYARRILGNKLIGKSCHSLTQAITAQQEGADYLSIGPIFKTPLKPKKSALGKRIIGRVKKRIKIPFFAIGGINLKNLAEVKRAGANHFAFCRLILNAKNKQEIIDKLKRLLAN
ncbi:MAG: thiamine phosphate synthase [Gammaproteobacteria bacterium]|nr:thiamine phosphate synthase [Gammaproteobacteria bacterium]